jgi:hypothetical protein
MFMVGSSVERNGRGGDRGSGERRPFGASCGTRERQAVLARALARSVAAWADTAAVTVVPAAFELAVALCAEHQIDADAGRHHGTDQKRALASQVFGQSAVDVSVQSDTHVVAGMSQWPIEVQEVDARLGRRGGKGGHHQATRSFFNPQASATVGQGPNSASKARWRAR